MKAIVNWGLVICVAATVAGMLFVANSASGEPTGNQTASANTGLLDPRVLVLLGVNVIALAVMWGRMTAVVSDLKTGFMSDLKPKVDVLVVDVAEIKATCKERGAKHCCE
jgi:hypothetical protein